MNSDQETSNDKLEIFKVFDQEVAQEGYQIEILDQISIKASSDAGFFYAEQTLNQLRLIHEVIPKLLIKDAPKYTWRGSMIDVARHFRSITYLKKHIQRMAFFKLNVLHLHLTDDQGWRIEIKGWPKLTTIGGSSSVGNDGGGFYTQAEMKDLIEFAAQYHISIVPEIDMPGHIQSALASYPLLACDGKKTTLYTGMRVGFSSLCLEKPEVIYPFVEDVINQLSGLFPSKYFHIGGDETKVAGYNQFIETVNDYLTKNGKIMIGWEEIVDAEVSSDTIIHHWQPHEKKLSIAEQKNLTILLSPCENTYLDHANDKKQKRVANWCDKDGIPLKQVYQLVPRQYDNVLGIEAQMWSERVDTDRDADNRLWPRLAAIAELSWSGRQSYPDFKKRLSQLRPWFDQQGIDYYKEADLGWD